MKARSEKEGRRSEIIHIIIHRIMQTKNTCVFESAHGRVAVNEIEEYSVADGGLYKGERIARFKGSLLGSDEGQRTYIARLEDLIITPAVA